MSLKTGSTTLGSEVRVPGSVANLGGGFDTLGVAVQLYLRATIADVRDDGGAKLVVTKSTPPVNGRNALEQAFEIIADRTGRPAPTVFVEVDERGADGGGLGQQRRGHSRRVARVRARHGTGSGCSPVGGGD